MDAIAELFVNLWQGTKLLIEVMWFCVFLIPSWWAGSYNSMGRISNKTMFIVIVVSFAVMMLGYTYLWS